MPKTERPNLITGFVRGVIPFAAAAWMLKEDMKPAERKVWAGLFAAIEIGTWVAPLIRLFTAETVDLVSLLYLCAGKGVEGSIFAVARGVIYNDNHPGTSQ